MARRTLSAHCRNPRRMGWGESLTHEVRESHIAHVRRPAHRLEYRTGFPAGARHRRCCVGNAHVHRPSLPVGWLHLWS